LILREKTEEADLEESRNKLISKEILEPIFGE
jgi:hypothetical protein